MSNEYNQGGPTTDGFLDNPLHSVRQQIEGQIGQAIDHYAGHVPGGHQFTPEAKQAVSGILDGLQRQLEAQAASRMGPLGGAAFGNPGSTGYQGNQGGYPGNQGGSQGNQGGYQGNQGGSQGNQNDQGSSLL